MYLVYSKTYVFYSWKIILKDTCHIIFCENEQSVYLHKFSIKVFFNKICMHITIPTNTVSCCLLKYRGFELYIY